MPQGQTLVGIASCLTAFAMTARTGAQHAVPLPTLDNFDLLLGQGIELIDQFINLPVGGLNLPRQELFHLPTLRPF
jgi:hypothetical protein